MPEIMPQVGSWTAGLTLSSNAKANAGGRVTGYVGGLLAGLLSAGWLAGFRAWVIDRAGALSGTWLRANDASAEQAAGQLSRIPRIQSNLAFAEHRQPVFAIGRFLHTSHTYEQVERQAALAGLVWPHHSLHFAVRGHLLVRVRSSTWRLVQQLPFESEVWPDWQA